MYLLTHSEVLAYNPISDQSEAVIPRVISCAEAGLRPRSGPNRDLGENQVDILLLMQIIWANRTC